MDGQPVTSRLPPPKPVQRRRRLAHFAAMLMIGLALGAVGGYLLTRYSPEVFTPIPAPRPWKLLALLALPVLWLVVVGVHELGHVVGGWLGGGRFLLMVVGPFMLRRTPSGIRFALNRSVNLGGGLAACLPADPARVTPHRTALMIASGPAASVLLALVSLVLAAALAGGESPGLGRAVLQNFMAGLGLFSAFIAVATATPSAFGGFKSDGLRLLQLLRGNRRSEQEAAILSLSAASLAGVQPRDFDPELVRRAVSLNDGSLFDLYARLTVYYHAADRGEWASAQTLLNEVMAGETRLAPHIRDVVRCEYAWLLATRTDDAAAARAWAESARKPDFDPAVWLRATAAVRLAEGKPAEAAALAREGLLALDRNAISPVRNPFAAAALEELLRRAETAPYPATQNS